MCTILGPFLTQSDCQSKTALFDWTFFRPDSSGPSSYRQSSRFYTFCVLPRGGCVRKFCCRAVEIGWQLCASRFLREQRLDEPRPSELMALGFAESRQSYSTFVGLHSAESRQSYSRRSRCWQHGIDTARCCRRVIHAAGERN